MKWQKTGPTGFGYYPVVDVAEMDGRNAEYDVESAQKFSNTGSILVVAGKEGWGGIWRKDTSGGATGWVKISRNLPSPHMVVEAAMHPENQDHILAIVPSDRSKTELLMYETTDGGRNWSEVAYFSNSANRLNDNRRGIMTNEDAADIEFFENGDVFVYNYNGASWGYHYDAESDTWGHSTMPSISSFTSPDTRNRLYFNSSGQGLLNPAKGLVFKSTDYGETWTQIDNLSGEHSFSFAISENGQTIYELYKQRFTVDDSLEQELNNNNITAGMARIFQNNGANLAAGGTVDSLGPERWKVWNGDSRWIVKEMDNDRLLMVQTCCYLKTSTDGGNNFTENELSKPFPARGPQGIIVDPDNSSRLTAFIYMEGPFFSIDGGSSWKRVYRNRNVKKKLVANVFYDSHFLRGDGSVEGMAKPTDYRDLMVIDGLPGNPLLVGSDQGLHVVSHPGNSISPVAFHNVAALLDFSQVYNMEVDDCGNLYQGLWHHSAMIREARKEGSIASDDLYYFGQGESNGMFLKSKSNCLDWSSMGDKLGDNVHDFRSYATRKNGRLEREDPGVRLRFKDQPVYYDDKWYYVNRSDWNMRATPLDSTKMKNLKNSGNLVVDTNVRKPLKDRAAGALYYASDFSSSGREPEDRGDSEAEAILRIEKNSSSVDTSLNLTGSSPEIQNHSGMPLYDVHDGRVITVIERYGREQVIIYNHDPNRSHTLDDFDFETAATFERFGDHDVHGVYVDPTDSDRYFARVKESNDTGAQCPFHLMITENSGQSWEIVSRELNCTKITDLAFHTSSETVYASTRSRGIFQADLSGLENTTDLSVDLACDRYVISETDGNDCYLDFTMKGQKKEIWKKSTNSVEIDIAFNFDGYIYSLRTSDNTLRSANCIKHTEKDPQGFRNITRIQCTSALEKFPMQQQFPIRFKIDRSHSTDTLNTISLAAGVDVNTGAQDLISRNDRDSVKIDVFDRDPYEKDRFDPHYSEQQGKVVGNDRMASPTMLGSDTWQHSGHYTCEGYQYGKNCATILTDTSKEAPEKTTETWTINLEPLSLPSSNDEDYYNVDLPEFHPLMRDKLSNLECGKNSVEIVQSATTMEEQPNKKKEEPGGQPAGGYVRNHRFDLSASTYLSYLENARPRGHTLRKIHATLKTAFSNHGISLSERARLSLLQGETDWNRADTWKIIDQGDTYIIEHRDTALRVYTRTSQKEADRTQNTVTKTVYTRGELIVSVNPENNDLVETPVSPRFVSLNGYRSDSGNSHLADGEMKTVSDNNEQVVMRIQCPKSAQHLSDLIISVGEDDLTAGGYTLNLRYRVTMTTREPNMQPMNLTMEQEPAERDQLGSRTRKSDPISLTIMGRGGSSLPGALNAGDVTSAAGATLSGEQSIFTVGGSLSFGSRNASTNFRLTALRSEGALSTAGTDPTLSGDGTFTAVTGDLILRPIPRFLIQPYAIGGLGAQKIAGPSLQDENWRFTTQVGLGADLRLGRRGVILGVEAVDYLSGFGGGNVTHHAFIAAVLGIPLF